MRNHINPAINRGQVNTTAFPTPSASVNRNNGLTYINPLNSKQLFFPFVQYQVTPIDLSATFANRELIIQGTTLSVPYSAGGNGLLWIAFNEVSNAQVPFQAGLNFNDFPFQRLYLNNPTAQAGVTLYLCTFIDLSSLNVLITG